jgi:hypothetical protein
MSSSSDQSLVVREQQQPTKSSPHYTSKRRKKKREEEEEEAVSSSLYANFLSTRHDPDSGHLWKEPQPMSPQKKYLSNIYRKQLKKARLSDIHLLHLRDFKSKRTKAKPKENSNEYIKKVCQSGVQVLRERKEKLERESRIAEEETRLDALESRVPDNVEIVRTAMAPPGFDRMKHHPYYSSTWKGFDMHEYISNWSGFWRDGKMHGPGTLVHSDGGETTARFTENRANCEKDGVSILPEGTRYEGGFRDGLFHGHGKITYKDSGIIYEGEFRNGLRHGKGQVRFPSGQSYVGMFKRGDYHGQGVLLSSTGHKYEGTFERGLICGPGKLVLRDGTKFVRNWKPRMTMRECIEEVRIDMRAQILARKLEMDTLMTHVRKIRLEQYIDAVRDQIEFEKEEEVRIAKEEKRKADVERRKKIIEAKKQMLEDLAKGKKDDESDEETDSSADENDESEKKDDDE